MCLNFYYCFGIPNSLRKDVGAPLKVRDVDSTSTHEWVQVFYTLHYDTKSELNAVNILKKDEGVPLK